MNVPAIVRTLILAFLATSSALASDLGSIDRTIAKEPAYPSKDPKYCLAVFGEKAQTRIWMVLDREVLFIDRNANGDLTELGENIAGKPVANSPGEIEFTTAIHKNDGVPSDCRIEVRLVSGLTFVYRHVKGQPWQRAVVDNKGYLKFADKRENAPVLHFDGPITIGLRFAHRLKRQGRPEDLDIMVGTPGVGVGSFVRFGHEGIAPDLRPVVEIDFPTGNAKTVHLKTTLDKRC